MTGSIHRRIADRIRGDGETARASGPIAATDLLGGVLAEVVHTVPYSSASQFYEYFGDTPADTRYGKSCAWQSFEVGRRLAAVGGPTVRYHVDGRHVAAVVHSDEGLDVLDPYLMHLEPVRLRHADARPDGSVVAAVPALPIRLDADGSPRPGRVRASWLPRRNRLKLEYLRFSPTRGHHVVSRFFTLPTDRELRVVPPPADVIRPLLVHPEQNNISVRVVDPQDGQVREVIYPLGQVGPRAPVDADRLCARDNQGAVIRHGHPDFTDTVGAIAHSLGVVPAEVLGFVLGGARIHRQVSPGELELAEYQLVNE